MTYKFQVKIHYHYRNWINANKWNVAYVTWTLINSHFNRKCPASLLVQNYNLTQILPHYLSGLIINTMHGLKNWYNVVEIPRCHTSSPLPWHLLPVALAAVALPLRVAEVVAAILALQVTLVDAQGRHLRREAHVLVRPLQVGPE